MKKLFVLAAATLVMGSAFAYDCGKDKKCGKDKSCCKKTEKASTTTVKATTKPATKKA
jgi:uncharacterized protein YdeI (BOF family)